MLFYTVQGNKGQQDGYSLNVLLIFRIVAVVLVLTDLQTASAAEHNEDDSCIADQSHDPLTPVPHTADAGNQHAGPENHLAQIVGAADEAVQAGIYKAAGIFLLCIVLAVSIAIFGINAWGIKSALNENAINKGAGSFLLCIVLLNIRS